MKTSFLSLIALLASVVAVTTSCLQGPKFMKQDKSANFVQTLSGESSGGAVEVKVNPSSGSTQVIEASGDNDSLKGTSVAFPPGSLAISMTVKVEEAAPILASSALTDLGYSDSSSVAAASNAVLITSSEKTDVVKPFSLSIPLSSSASLHLAGKAVSILYRIFNYAENRYIVGLIPTSKVALTSDKAQFEAPNFGSFQAVYLEVAEVKTATSSAPILSKTEVATLPEFAVRGLTVRPDVAARKFIVNFEVVGQNILKGCKVIGDNDQVPPFDKEEQIGTATNTAIAAKGNEEINGFIKVECIDNNGRLAQAGWSEKVTLPAVATPTPTVAATPVATPTRTPTPTPTMPPAPGSFTITNPGASVTTTSVTVTWTAASGAVGYTVKLGYNTDCSSGSGHTATAMSTSHTFTGVSDGSWFACVVANSPFGQTPASNNGRYFTVATTSSGPATALALTITLPSWIIVDQQFSFGVKAVRADGTTVGDWANYGIFSPATDPSCNYPASGALASSANPNMNYVNGSGGVWTFSDLTFNERGTLFVKVISGGLTGCFGPIPVGTGGCTNPGGYPNVGDADGHPAMPYMVACRDLSTATHNKTWSTTKTFCNASGGWHMCYPSEFDRIMRYTHQDGLMMPAPMMGSAFVFLNDEGSVNNGAANSFKILSDSSGTGTCSTVGASHRMIAGGHSDADKFAYNYNYCQSTASGDFSNYTGYRTASPYYGMRYILETLDTAGDGAMCCKNTHTHFNCSNFNYDNTGCGNHNDACQWDTSTSQCNPR